MAARLPKMERGFLKMTFEQAFLKVKEKFDNADAKGVADFAIQVTFTDEDCGGTFYAEVKDGKLAVEPYDYVDNNAVLNITKAALLAVLSGRSSLDKAIANGDAYVQGDASKVADWKATIKKAPAKKTAAKKTTAAKKAPAKKTTAAKKPAAKKTTTAAKKPAAKKAAATAKKAAPAVKAEAKTEVKAAPVKAEVKKAEATPAVKKATTTTTTAKKN